jgi:hypothetical protein
MSTCNKGVEQLVRKRKYKNCTVEEKKILRLQGREEGKRGEYDNTDYEDIKVTKR